MTDPRVERTRRRVLDAAIALIVESGYQGFNIDALARRAGVARTTVYRHWSSVNEILVEAVDVLRPQFTVPAERARRPQPDDPIGAIVRGLATTLWSTPVGAILAAASDAAERDPEMRTLLASLAQGRAEFGRQLIEDAQRRGVLRADVDAATIVELLAGTLFRRRLIERGDASPAALDTLIAQLRVVFGPSPRRRASRSASPGSAPSAPGS